MQEKSINEMNGVELRSALAEYERETRPTQAPAPLPPGITADMSPKAQETATNLYVESLMRKPAGSLTPEERVFLRQSIGPTLKALGY
jgi:hypothetical protein